MAAEQDAALDTNITHASDPLSAAPVAEPRAAQEIPEASSTHNEPCACASCGDPSCIPEKSPEATLSILFVHLRKEHALYAASDTKVSAALKERQTRYNRILSRATKLTSEWVSSTGQGRQVWRQCCKVRS